jgi:hypothetical protein
MRLGDIIKNPRIALILGVVLGLALGLLIGWVLWPVDYTDAVPQTLSQQYQEEYLRMAMDSYHLTEDPALAFQRWENIGPKAPALLAAIIQNPGSQKPAWILDYKSLIENRLGQIQPSTTSTETPPFTTSTNTSSSKTRQIIIILGSLLALCVIGGAVYIFFLKPLLYGKRPPTGEVSAARQAQEITNTVEKTDFAELGLAKPITQTMTTYVLGDDLYDESFSIDSQSGEFLGEYGVGVSEMMGVGEPKKVTAIEIWLFDKNDIKTATKVLMSQHAYNDQNIRSRLEAKGELVLIQPQGQVVLETATLQLLATVVDLEYGHGNMPERSYFERITLELAIWPK